MVFSISHCTHHHYTGECILEIVSPELSKLSRQQKNKRSPCEKEDWIHWKRDILLFTFTCVFYTPSHFYVYLCFAYWNSDIFWAFSHRWIPASILPIIWQFSFAVSAGKKCIFPGDNCSVNARQTARFPLVHYHFPSVQQRIRRS